MNVRAKLDFSGRRDLITGNNCAVGLLKCEAKIGASTFPVTSSVDSGESFPIPLFGVMRSVSFGSKYSSRAIPPESM